MPGDSLGRLGATKCFQNAHCHQCGTCINILQLCHNHSLSTKKGFILRNGHKSVIRKRALYPMRFHRMFSGVGIEHLIQPCMIEKMLNWLHSSHLTLKLVHCNFSNTTTFLKSHAELKIINNYVMISNILGLWFACQPIVE